LVPVNLWVRVSTDPRDASLRCRFLPSQLDFTYSMIIGACNAASGFICAACSLDSFLHLRRARHPAQEMVTRIVGSSAGGSGGGSDDGGGGSAVSTKPGQQLRLSAEFDARKHAWEAWRVTSLANAIAFFFNHLPMLILDFSALVAWPSRSGSEYIILLLLETIVLPNSLWAVAVRYRHVIGAYSRRNSRAD
uniref:G protein-coupled receptor n=1 Tax=Macrostomum lignano TaxID=282301 RepID=A0A1I8IIJ4_9PLAT